MRPWNVASKWGEQDDNTLGALSTVGPQLTLSGALNPSGGGENSVDDALGVGFSVIGNATVDRLWTAFRTSFAS